MYSTHDTDAKYILVIIVYSTHDNYKDIFSICISEFHTAEPAC